MKQSFLILTLFLSFILSFGQEINSTIQRDTIQSKVLNDDREISIYLPPSYFSSDQNFPVLYILDGDYNFQYVSGLLELQSSIAENIPEMILVGISGKGTDTYRMNCKPNIDGLEDKGNADLYSDFIGKELIPFVNGKYKASDFKILAGHSIGGLFIINTALHNPNSFNDYIAISPALWWENNAINQVANTTLKSNPDFKTNLYVSLANEKGMGVDSFLAVATGSLLKNQIVSIGITVLTIILAIFLFIKSRRKMMPFLLLLVGLGIASYLYFLYMPSNNNFKFKQFPNENHNSVGSPTYVWALQDIFKTWKGPEEYFNSTAELNSYHDEVLKMYGQTFNLQNGLTGNTIYILQDSPFELEKFQAELKNSYPNSVANFNNQWAERMMTNEQNDKAINLLNQTIKDYPDFFGSYNTLAKVKIENKEYAIADSLVSKAIQLANSQKLRQWQLNELLETKEKVSTANKIIE